MKASVVAFRLPIDESKETVSFCWLLTACLTSDPSFRWLSNSNRKKTAGFSLVLLIAISSLSEIDVRY